MLLAAGHGRRMLPITLSRAKPTLPFLHRPLLLRQLDYLQAAGVGEVVINLHHQAASIRQLLAAADEEGTLGNLAVQLSDEAEILGTSGGLRGAAHQLRGAGTIICLNADMITGLDLGAAVTEHHRRGRSATLILTPWWEGCRETPVHHHAGLLTGFGGAPPDPMGGDATEPLGDAAGPPGVFTGIHLLEEELLDRLPPGRSEFVPDLYQPLLAAGRAPAVIMSDAPWFEVGTPERYITAQLLARQMPAPAGHRPWPATATPTAAAWPGVGADAILHPTVQIGPAATVVRSVLMENVQVGAGSRLEEVIAGPGTCVPDGMVIRCAILAPAAPRPAELPQGIRQDEGILRADF